MAAQIAARCPVCKRDVEKLRIFHGEQMCLDCVESYEERERGDVDAHGFTVDDDF